MWVRRIKIMLALSAVCLCLAASAPLAVRSLSQQPKDYSRFTHQTHSGAVKIPGTEQTRELKCDDCHERRAARAPVPARVETTERNQRRQVSFPGHKACVECHVAQFTSRPPQTCNICHRAEPGLTASPPQRDFPGRLGFNAFFDARQHEAHAGYALPGGQKVGCAFCHQPTAKSAALTIPAHQECYACHTPASGDAKASLKAGCAVCHTQMVASVEPFAAKYKSRAYGARFAHRTHVEYVGGNCAACHTIAGGYNQPAPRTIKVKQHLSPGERSGRGCFSCHDGGTHYGRAVFSGDYGEKGSASCDKCHTRPDLKVFPAEGEE